jgi:hypothetical protein
LTFKYKILFNPEGLERLRKEAFSCRDRKQRIRGVEKKKVWSSFCSHFMVILSQDCWQQQKRRFQVDSLNLIYKLVILKTKKIQIFVNFFFLNDICSVLHILQHLKILTSKLKFVLSWIAMQFYNLFIYLI